MDTTVNPVQTRWTVDGKHSEIAFKIRHLMIANIKGFFRDFDASIYTMGKDFSTAEIDLWIDAATVYTGDHIRDQHLISAEFFDVAAHKQITFISSTIGKPDKHGNHELWGELTMKGVTKVIQLNVRFGGVGQDPEGVEKAGFTVTGKINRTDWGLNWNKVLEAGGLLVGETIHISCEMELINSGLEEMKMVLASGDNGLPVY
jgi:polyisoprenoid-binding protein YceI